MGDTAPGMLLSDADLIGFPATTRSVAGTWMYGSAAGSEAVIVSAVDGGTPSMRYALPDGWRGRPLGLVDGLPIVGVFLAECNGPEGDNADCGDSGPTRTIVAERTGDDLRWRDLGAYHEPSSTDAAAPTFVDEVTTVSDDLVVGVGVGVYDLRSGGAVTLDSSGIGRPTICDTDRADVFLVAGVREETATVGGVPMLIGDRAILVTGGAPRDIPPPEPYVAARCSGDGLILLAASGNLLRLGTDGMWMVEGSVPSDPLAAVTFGIVPSAIGVVIDRGGSGDQLAERLHWFVDGVERPLDLSVLGSIPEDHANAVTFAVYVDTTGSVVVAHQDLPENDPRRVR